MNSGENWELKIDPAVYKQVWKIPAKSRMLIFRAIEAMTLDPFAGDIVKLEGKLGIGWRRRVGAYRIFYEVNIPARLVRVVEIKRRTSTTY